MSRKNDSFEIFSNLSTSTSTFSNQTVHPTDSIKIPSSISTTISYSGSLKRPYSSVKHLDLSQFSKCNQELNISAKRLRSNNEDTSFSHSFNVIDSLKKPIEPLSLQRPSSRLSISTASSTSTTPALYKNSKFLFSSKRLSTPDGYETKFPRNLNSSNNLIAQSSSRFYAGKTVFGGANLRKSVRRLSTTPYALSNVRTIEPTVNRQSSSFLKGEDLHLSSLTQRILDSLEKSAIPIQDAKRRFSTSYQSNFEQTPSKTLQTSKLFDTSFPSVKNNGLCKVDFSFKPTKYVLTPVSDEKKVHKINLDKDIEKLNEIRREEQALEKNKQETEYEVFQSRKDQTFGKITRRDERKNYKGLSENINVEDDNNNNDNHLDNLASVKPLSVPATTLKQFSLSSKAEKSTFDNTSKEIPKETKKEQSTISTLFQFSSPTNLGSLFSSNTNSSLDVNFSSPTDVSSSIVQKLSQQRDNWGEKYLSKGKDWNSADEIKKKVFNEVENGSISKDTDLTVTIEDNISLFALKQKKKANTWSCPTCCIDNDSNISACVACEEPNPNIKLEKSASVANSKLPEFKFGNFSQPVTSTINVISKPIVSESPVFQKDSLQTALETNSLSSSAPTGTIFKFDSTDNEITVDTPTSSMYLFVYIIFNFIFFSFYIIFVNQ